MRPCTIVGNVGNAPEMRYTPNGVAVVNFSLALYGGKTQAGESITTWVRCTAWKDLAEVVSKKVGKGDKIMVEGYLEPVETYETRDKTIGYSIKLTAWSVKALEFAPVDLELPDKEEVAP